MPRYSVEFKAKVFEKMMPPDARTVADVHRETGVSEPTLYAWRREFQNRGHAVPADPANAESWSGRDKLAVVIETAALNEQALSEYCRRKGLYPEQIERWKEAAMAGSAEPSGVPPGFYLWYAAPRVMPADQPHELSPPVAEPHCRWEPVESQRISLRRGARLDLSNAKADPRDGQQACKHREYMWTFRKIFFRIRCRNWVRG
jgi:transposase-like protein